MQNSDVNLYYDQVQSIFLENLDVLLRGFHFKNEACFFIPCVDILLLQVFHALIQMNYILGEKLSNVMYVRGLCMIELIWLSLFTVQLRIYFLHLDLQVALVESLHMYRRNIWY